MWPQNVTKADLRVEFYRGSGPGGQHKNKRDTACRITHIPTGLAACAEDSKSQTDNKRNAFKKLAKKLIPMMLPKIEKFEGEFQRIRTYHAVRNKVKDERLSKTWSYDDVVNGKALEEIIDSLVETTAGQ